MNNSVLINKLISKIEARIKELESVRNKAKTTHEYYGALGAIGALNWILNMIKLN